MSEENSELTAQLSDVFAEKPGLQRRLHTHGVRDDMPMVYAAADVVALTSSSGEAAPLCLIEGMMCGAIPVATDIGDCASIVDGRGLITEPDPEAISAAWAEAVARRAEWTPALAEVRERFSRSRMAAGYAAVIEKAAAQS
jgi:glycosyltransferase involved in cell wall biosynthesis